MLTPEEFKGLLVELKEPYKTMVGLSKGSVLGLMGHKIGHSLEPFKKLVA